MRGVKGIKMQLYSMTDITRLTGFSKAGIYKQIERGIFPKQIKLGERASRWPANEVQEVLTARCAGVNAEEIRELVSRLHNERGLAWMLGKPRMAA